MMRAASLNVDLYEEVEADETATGQAAMVVGIIAIRQALDFSTGKAVATALLRWLALVIVGVGTVMLTGARRAT